MIQQEKFGFKMGSKEKKPVDGIDYAACCRSKIFS
jgi:hypothetical protein